MARKRKTLPKNFQELIEKGNIEELKSVFDTCEINAKGGYDKSTAISFHKVPDELVRWLIENGLDINEASYTYKQTPLHQQARSGDVSVLIELGANINAKGSQGNTPLHFAAEYNLDAVEKLIKNGAKIDAKNDSYETPLEYALSRADNLRIVKLVPISRVFLSHKCAITEKMKKSVTQIGENFEFHRQNFNKEMLPETDRALTELYKLYKVTPVKKRFMHDGKSPILVEGKTWQEQFENLWQLLIPSSGSAETVQGEVVRIAGKVRDEICRNGAVNWDRNYKKMLDAYAKFIASGNTVEKDIVEKVHSTVKHIRKNRVEDYDLLDYLCKIATEWVKLNKEPIPLGKVNYKK